MVLDNDDLKTYCSTRAATTAIIKTDKP